jgi:hypothetical protein
MSKYSVIGWGSSVSVVSDYGLDNRVFEIRFPTKAKTIFSLTSVSRPDLGPTQLPF